MPNVLDSLWVVSLHVTFVLCFHFVAPNMFTSLLNVHTRLTACFVKGKELAFLGGASKFKHSILLFFIANYKLKLAIKHKGNRI